MIVDTASGVRKFADADTEYQLMRTLIVEPSSRTLSLAEAIAKVTELGTWLEGAGVRRKGSFDVMNTNLERPKPVISSLAEAQIAVSNEELMIAAINLFAGTQVVRLGSQLMRLAVRE